MTIQAPAPTINLCITRTSMYSGIDHTWTFAFTPEEVAAYAGWLAGDIPFIQTALAHRTADEREFLLTGITADEWELMYPDDADEEMGEDLGEDVAP